MKTTTLPTKNTYGRAFLVLGAESTGTRMATKILIKNGVWGQYSHNQITDDFDPKHLEGKSFVVIRRSIPHRQETPDLNKILDYLKDYSLAVVVTVRTWDFAMTSQQKRTHILHSTPLDRTSMAYRHIFKFINDNNLFYVMLNMGGLIYDPKGQQEWLLNTLGIPVKEFLEIKDTNAKHVKD